ncbi:hypothetical protein [Thermocatellispora tengchongensis]|uniref:hypothetical protein n=1 Tax=Thermocatellispora tengchongensis TaxID=1073253 RepID=UPI003625BE38
MSGTGPGIDRRALVARHAVEVSGVVAESPLSVGNGEFCYTADVTGLQTFPGLYPVQDPGGGGRGTLLGTMSSWGWHSVPAAEPYDLAATMRTYRTPRGPVAYVDMRGGLSAHGESPSSAAESWLRANPHRLDLGRVGLVLHGAPPAPADLAGARQRLDLWTGAIGSRFRLGGVPVRVTTVCHPRRDVLALRVESDLLASGLAVRFAFPYGSQAWSDAADWSRPEAPPPS